ncbi:hypothetical protein [Elizabethkingia ursingii]|uniref:Uncharacterized protein n=1 Tax=Elizabethkingia ursingii TaxID=1756150 RepID=A0AAJ3NFJ8_9FLAO|nr:hypothetical protein [Elizabethkingia ursingii]AQX07310.1 hypothetical protein BBD34_00990 [Elizabethkingia ursingii]OPB80284.1 hypothetical protein BAY32_14740 [Elizabethkingia ursingii]
MAYYRIYLTFNVAFLLFYLFKYQSQEHLSNSDLELFSLLADAQAVDYENKRMMKKKKKERKL